MNANLKRLESNFSRIKNTTSVVSNLRRTWSFFLVVNPLHLNSVEGKTQKNLDFFCKYWAEFLRSQWVEMLKQKVKWKMMLAIYRFCSHSQIHAHTFITSLAVSEVINGTLKTNKKQIDFLFLLFLMSSYSLHAEKAEKGKCLTGRVDRRWDFGMNFFKFK